MLKLQPNDKNVCTMWFGTWLFAYMYHNFFWKIFVNLKNFKSVFGNFLEKFDKGSENFGSSSIKLGKYSI